MSKYYLGFILVLIVLVSACDNEIGDEALFIAKSSVQGITIVENASKSVTFDTKNVWFSTCGSFHHVDKLANGNEIAIMVYGSQLKNAYCPEEFSIFNSRFTINTDETGDHLFRFWVTEIVTLDTTINVLD